MLPKSALPWRWRDCKRAFCPCSGLKYVLLLQRVLKNGWISDQKKSEKSPKCRKSSRKHKTHSPKTKIIWKSTRYYSKNWANSTNPKNADLALLCRKWKKRVLCMTHKQCGNNCAIMPNTGTGKQDMVVRPALDTDRSRSIVWMLSLKAVYRGKMSGGHYYGETSQGFQFYWG